MPNIKSWLAAAAFAALLAGCGGPSESPASPAPQDTADASTDAEGAIPDAEGEMPDAEAGLPDAGEERPDSTPDPGDAEADTSPGDDVEMGQDTELDTPDGTTRPEGDPADLTVGERFEVKLESNASTGYTWVLSDAFDQNVVTLVEERFEAPEDGPPGAPGHQIFTFEAAGTGSTSLHLDYVRPFDDPPAPIESHAVDVNVM